MKKVSIILPSLNVAGYIEECISSVMNQTLWDIEIICVDAGSTDGTREILEQCAKRDSRITIMDSKVKSYGKQVNMGISSARGKYIAILETDDYVDKHMYEELYHIAESKDLDFVFGEFDLFFENEDGKREATTISTLAGHTEVYGKILTADNLKETYYSNPNLWRGIYSKKFLDENKIFLNETLGAAYQDICFMHRVMMNTKRAIYVPESYYRYRTDRIGSSVNSTKGLQFAYQEYRILFDNQEIKKGFETRIYYMMVNAFIGEIMQIFPRMDKQWEGENKVYYEWFKEKLLEGIDKGFLNENIVGKYQWKRLNILLHSLEDFLIKLKYPDNLAFLLKDVKNEKAIIFGAGHRGLFLHSNLKNLISIDAVCDNNQKLWNTKVEETDILSLADCVKLYKDDFYIISVKRQIDDIRKQLISSGIDERKILLYIADSD